MENSLIIWLPDGKTLLFKEVSHVAATDDTLTFTYKGVSTKTTRNARFNLDKILGSALSKQP